MEGVDVNGALQRLWYLPLTSRLGPVKLEFRVKNERVAPDQARPMVPDYWDYVMPLVTSAQVNDTRYPTSLRE